MKKQVDKSHYRFASYVTKQRWMSLWHQLSEILQLEPDSVLEIGPGPRMFGTLSELFGVRVDTVDLDPELNPTFVASATDMPLDDHSYDVVCAFQMLEHLPFESSLLAFAEMSRVAKSHVVISLPDASRRWPYSIYVPKIGPVEFQLPRPTLRAAVHEFDGEHYWELEKHGYKVKDVVARFEKNNNVRLRRSFRVHENPYHRFFVFTKE